MGFETQEELERWYEEAEFMADWRKDEAMLAAWHQQEQERHKQTVDALNRCAEAGAKDEDIKILAVELGIDWRKQ